MRQSSIRVGKKYIRLGPGNSYQTRYVRRLFRGTDERVYVEYVDLHSVNEAVSKEELGEAILLASFARWADRRYEKTECLCLERGKGILVGDLLVRDGPYR